MSTSRFLSPFQILLLAAFFSAQIATAADWPMFGRDPQRTFASPAPLPATLNLRWSLKLPRLQPAWLDQPRVHTDAAYHPIVVGTRMIIASTCDDAISAYDLADGRLAWQFITAGPVRYAPAVENGRLFAGSDDGYLYALSADTGKLLWKLKLAPQHRPILGNGRIIDTWCVRGGPVVDQGTVYFAAGIWPFMGVFIGCADAATGKVLWCNSGDGSSFAKGPHSSWAYGTLSPQGPLALAGDRLIVPNGRAMPASLDRATGEFQYFQNNNKTGGDRATVAGPFLFDGGQGFAPDNGTLIATLPGSPIVVGQTAYSVGVNEIRSIDFAHPDNSPAALLEKGIKKKFPTRKTEIPGVKLAVAAGKVLYAAGDDWVAAFDLPLKDKDKPKPIWKLPVDGKPADLVAAGDCLIITTETGTIHCFAATRATPRIIDTLATTSSAIPPAAGPIKSIAADPAIAGDYAVVAGTSGELLARQLISQGLGHVIILEPDAIRADAIRRRLIAENLGARRIAVIVADIAAQPSSLPPLFAGLIVIDNTVPPSPATAQAIFQWLHPYHGSALFLSEAGWRDPLTSLTRIDPTRAQLTASVNTLSLTRRNGLPGAGSWTHENADTANSRNSGDSLVKAPLGILWFGGSSNELILPRHGHGPQPQVVGGRIFILGMDLLRALDAFTGRILWEASLPGVGSYYNHTSHNPGANGTGSCYVSTPDSVYVAMGNQCLRLDAATGKTLATFKLPQIPGVTPDSLWSFLAVSGDRLVGGASPPSTGPGAAKQEKDPEDRDDDPLHKHVVSNPRTVGSRVLFVLERTTGKMFWARPAGVGEFRHNATAIAAGKLFTIDRPVAKPETKIFGLLDPIDDGPPPILYALDFTTGREIWKAADKVFGTVLACSQEHDTLIEAGRVTRDSLRDEPKGMRAYKLSTGEVRWFDPKLKGPVILHGKSLLSDGWGCELLTGKTLNFPDPITGAGQRFAFLRANGCNAPAGSQNLLTFRSGAAGFYDLARFGGTGNFGGFRSSCTNNLIVAEGLICSPDYTRTCVCAHPIQTSLALIPDQAAEMWTYQAASDAPKGRIKRLGINLGAPGDRVDDNGTLWLEFPPNPSKSPKAAVKFEPELKDLTFFRQHASTVAGPLPWVAASGVLGLRSITLDMKGTNRHLYTVRLTFINRAAPGIDPTVMDIDLQGRRVESALNLAKAASPNHAIVREYRSVELINQLTIELKSKTNAPTLLCGVEIILEK